MTKLNESEHSFTKISEAIRIMCHTTVGALDRGFLCKSIGVLKGNEVVVVLETASVDEVLTILQSKKIGCIGIVDADGKIVGIFSERDFILKVARNFPTAKSDPISRYMTRNPITQTSDCTIAYALNLMSEGGFRNLPVVDEHGVPIAIVSVKEVIDYLVESFTSALLEFPLDKELHD